MSAEIVNLRRVRKAKGRVDKERQAAESRTKSGRGKAERVATDADRVRAQRELDGAERIRPVDGARED